MDTSLATMLSASNFTGLSLSLLDEYLNKTFYMSPEIIDPPLPETLNETVSIASTNSSSDSGFPDILGMMNMSFDEGWSDLLATRILQIDVVELIGYIQSVGPFNRSVLVQAVDSLLPSVVESLGVQINSTSIPSGLDFFQLLDNITSQLIGVNFAFDDSLVNGTWFGNETWSDNILSNATRTIDLDLFNRTMRGSNFSLDGLFGDNTTIGELLDSGLFRDNTTIGGLLGGNFTIDGLLGSNITLDGLLGGNFTLDAILGSNFTLNGTLLDRFPALEKIDSINGTEIESLSNAIAVATTIILRESLKDVPVSIRSLLGRFQSARNSYRCSSGNEYDVGFFRAPRRCIFSWWRQWIRPCI